MPQEGIWEHVTMYWNHSPWRHGECMCRPLDAPHARAHSHTAGAAPSAPQTDKRPVATPIWVVGGHRGHRPWRLLCLLVGRAVETICGMCPPLGDTSRSPPHTPCYAPHSRGRLIPPLIITCTRARLHAATATGDVAKELCPCGQARLPSLRW